MKTKVLITLVALLMLLPPVSAEMVSWKDTTTIPFGLFDVTFGFNVSNKSTYPTNESSPIYVMIKNNFVDFSAEGAFYNQDFDVSLSKEYVLKDGMLEISNFTTNMIPEFRKGETIIVKFEGK